MKQTQHCDTDMVKFQQTWRQEGYMAVNLPNPMVGMVPWKSVPTRGPQDGEPKTSMLGHRFLGSLLQL